MPIINILWTFEREELYDGEFSSRKAAQEHADELYMEECNEDSPENGAMYREQYELISFYFNDDGERAILERRKSELCYVHYHGDHAEHFSQGDFL